MAFNFSPKVVTDGLALTLDATNPKSYISGSTIWYDLSSNVNNVSLINTPISVYTNVQSYEFNGTNQTAVSSYAHAITGSNPWTISVWANVSSSESGGGRKGWLIWEGGPGQGVNELIAMGVTSGYIEIAHWSNDIGYPNATVTFDGWSMYSCVYNGTNEYVYVNGIRKGSSTFTLSTTTGSWYLCSRANQSEFLNSKIAAFSVYNRALSDTEILQNYNALKGRFGLK
jgi:hypothetical protein